jgi:hypothetical protein
MKTLYAVSRSLIVSAVSSILLIASGCGGGSQSSIQPPPPAIVVTVSPATANVTVGATADFTAAVANTTNASVTWTIEEGSTGGTVTNFGKYTAPAGVGTYHVVATSEMDHSKTGRATVTVNPLPPPAFGSLPPTDAAESSLYSYEIAATDPSGEQVSLELTDGPVGATLADRTLTWTPTWDQSRVDNAFTVTAKTPSGRAATQTWVVAPRGSIHGKMFYRHLLESGVQTETIDFAIASCSIFYRSTDGTLVQHNSTGLSDGTFTIPDIPAGHYWFVLWSWAPGWSWDPIWTDTKSIDMSVPFLGRSASRDGSRVRQYSIDGLQPAGQDDWISWWVPNVGESSSWTVTPGVTEFSLSIPATYWLDASKGDQAYAMQLVSGTAVGTQYHALAKMVGPLALTDTAAGASEVTGTLTDVPRDQSIRASVAMSKFSQLAAAGAPSVGQGPAYLSVNAHPYGISEGALIDLATAHFLLAAMLPDATAPPANDVDLGDILYGDPFPSEWTQLVGYEHRVSVAVQFPGATYLAGFGGVVSQITSEFPTADKPLEPLINPITNLRIDGQDFFHAATISAAPTLTWDAPADKAPNGYLLNLFEIALGTNSTTTVKWVQGFRTDANEVWFPPGTMQPGHSYFLQIDAVYEGGRDFGSAPFLKGFPRARSPYFSGIMTVGSGSVQGGSAPAAFVRGAESNRQLHMRAVKQEGPK